MACTYDYSKLRGRIVEKLGTQQTFAKRMDWSERTVISKMKNRLPWRQPDIQKAADILEINQEDIAEYFFKLKV